MTPNEYQIEAYRTVMPDDKQAYKIIDELKARPAYSQIIVAALKLNSESGELADAIVKNISYGQPLDGLNIIEECGDLLWYIALILSSMNVSMEQCMQENIDKLRIRYPEKFTEEHATKRFDKHICVACGVWTPSI